MTGVHTLVDGTARGYTGLLVGISGRGVFSIRPAKGKVVQVTTGERSIDRWKSRMAGQVFQRLREDIIRGILPPGSHIAEVDLCTRMNVSRTPVREALIKLVEEGLVHIYPQFGSFVAPISVEAVREGQYVREHLECALVADATRMMTPNAVQMIRENLALQRAAIENDDAEAFHVQDNAFHALFAELSEHRIVWQSVLQAKTHLDRVRHLSVHNPRQLPKLLRQHEEIAEAMINGDAAEASARLRLHLREVLDTIRDLKLSEQIPASPPQRRRTVRNRPNPESLG